MDTNRLRYFVTVAHAGSLAAASEIIRLSPAALSKAMGILESELGHSLFVRVGRGIRLSDDGRRLLPRIEAALKELEALRSVEPLPSSLRLATFEVFSTYVLGEMVEVGELPPQIEVHEILPGEIERAIRDGRCDYGLTYLPIPASDIEFLKLGKIGMAVCGRPKFDDLNFAELPFAVPIAPLDGVPTRARGLDGWPEDLKPRSVRYRVALMQSALELCSRGHAVAYLPKFILPLYNRTTIAGRQLKILEGHFPTGEQDVFLVKRRGTEEGTTVKRLAKAIRQII